MLRASAIIRPQASSGVACAEPVVPTTGIPFTLHQSKSMAAFLIPAVATSLRFGRRDSRSPPMGERSRMTQMMSNGCNLSANPSSSLVGFVEERDLVVRQR